MKQILLLLFISLATIGANAQNAVAYGIPSVCAVSGNGALGMLTGMPTIIGESITGGFVFAETVGSLTDIEQPTTVSETVPQLSKDGNSLFLSSSARPVHLSFFTLSGQQLTSHEAMKSEMTINISNFPNCFIVKVHSEENCKVYKVVRKSK